MGTLRAGAVAVVVLVSTAVAVSPARAQAVRTPVQLTAVASAGAVAGEFWDTATLSGGRDLTGTVTFTLFGPNDDTCSRAPVSTSVRPVSGVGTGPVTVSSDRVVVTAPGVYHFVASYSGDAVHAPAATACLDPNQAVGFGSSSFAFSAQASPATTPVGGSISDAATITTDGRPTGTITFSLFGPDAPACTGAPLFTSVTPVDGNGTYRSGTYTPLRPGAYRWVAAYSGGSGEPSGATACQDPAQHAEVTPATWYPGPCAVLRTLGQTLGVVLGPRVSGLLDGALAGAVCG